MLIGYQSLKFSAEGRARGPGWVSGSSFGLWMNFLKCRYLCRLMSPGCLFRSDTACLSLCGIVAEACISRINNNNNNMSLWVALLLHLLLVVERADSIKGEFVFVILMEQSFNSKGVLYPAGRVGPQLIRFQLVLHVQRFYRLQENWNG